MALTMRRAFDGCEVALAIGERFRSCGVEQFGAVSVGETAAPVVLVAVNDAADARDSGVAQPVATCAASKTGRADGEVLDDVLEWVTLAGIALLGAQPATTWRDPSPHRTRLVTVDSSVRLEVLDWGGSGRPIVLLGCYLTAHVYDDIAPKLTDRFRVYGITRRGLGASDKPASGYSVQRSADDVLEVLEALKLQKPILVGTSCGGWVVTALGGRHGNRLGGLGTCKARKTRR